MSIKNGITTFSNTGNCTIDIDLIVKLFDKKCSVSKFNDEYRLILGNNKNPEMRAGISDDDAKSIISRLDLKESKSRTFRNASTFRLR